MRPPSARTLPPPPSLAETCSDLSASGETGPKSCRGGTHTQLSRLSFTVSRLPSVCVRVSTQTSTCVDLSMQLSMCDMRVEQTPTMLDIAKAHKL